MVEKFPGLTSFLLVWTAFPFWLLAVFIYSFVNSGKPANLYWYFYPFWISAAIWIFAPGLVGVCRFGYLWITKNQPFSTWDIFLGGLSPILLVSFMWFVYKMSTLKTGTIL
jgi:hypothetical protein